MSQAKQTLESIQSDFDRIALLADENWNHNAQYHKRLINRIPRQCGHVLEIGCGTGKFSRLLAARAENVLAIDLSPQMIRLAKEHSKLYPNIDFVTADAMTYHLPDNQFDCIATIATLHHLPVEAALRKIKKALKPGGTFVCLDLYQRSNLSDLVFDTAAFPANLFLRLVKTGKPRPPKEIRQAYAEHGKTDAYLTLPQIKQICADILPRARRQTLVLAVFCDLEKGKRAAKELLIELQKFIKFRRQSNFIQECRRFESRVNEFGLRKTAVERRLIPCINRFRLLALIEYVFADYLDDQIADASNLEESND